MSDENQNQKIRLVKPSEVRVVSVSKPTMLHAPAAPNLVYDGGFTTDFGGPIMPDDFASDTRLRFE